MKTFRTITQSYDNRVRFFWTLVSIAVLSLGLYVYAVAATIEHTVSRQSLLGQSQTLSAKVNELEYRDISIKNSLSLATALQSGFAEVTNPLYVSRTKGVLTLNVVSR